jgi:hypothetical protein
LAILFFVISLASFVFYTQIQELVRDLIHHAYLATPDSLLGKLFDTLAVNAQTIPEDAYIGKGLIILSRAKLTVAILAGVLLLPAIVLTLWMPFIQRKYHCLMEALSPLPVRPEWQN